MKIAYLARRPIPSRQAHAVQIVKMCEAFARLGHEVDLFANPGDASPATLYARYGVERSFRSHHYPLLKGPLAKWRYALRLAMSPAFHKADFFFGRDILSLTMCSVRGKPLVYEAHVIPPRGSPRWRRLDRLFGLPNFRGLVCVTSTLAKTYREQFPGLAREKLLVLPNAAAEPPPAEPTRPWAGREQAVQVGFVGRPFPGKGIEMVVAAARRLPHIDFHVVGAAASDLTWIEAPLPNNLQLHGYRPHGELGGYLRRFDIAVAPYGAEVQNASGVESAAITSPLKLLEYKAAGLPVIVSDLPGVRDILDGGETAMLVLPGDEQAFIAAVDRLASHPEERRRLGAAARQCFLDRHTVEARARRIVALAGEGSSAQ